MKEKMFQIIDQLAIFDSHNDQMVMYFLWTETSLGFISGNNNYRNVSTFDVIISYNKDIFVSINT